MWQPRCQESWPPKPLGRVPDGARVGTGTGPLTKLLQEDACHLLREDPAHPDEAGEVPPSTELHDQVDVVAVPLQDDPVMLPWPVPLCLPPTQSPPRLVCLVAGTRPHGYTLGEPGWTPGPNPNGWWLSAIPPPHLEVLELHDVWVADGLQDLNLRQQVLHRRPVEALLAHALDGHHLTRVPLPRGTSPAAPTPPKQPPCGVLPQPDRGGPGWEKPLGRK